VQVGAVYLGGGDCRFTVWAPLRDGVSVVFTDPARRELPLAKDARGYWHGEAGDVLPGTEYAIRLDQDLRRPDPASHFQPQGVHQASQVVDHLGFPWAEENWGGVPLDEMVIYELHVGTFTPEGTFDGVISRLGDLRELGVTAVELMPVAQFPGGRNWGYDGVYPYAPQNSYGGPDGLKRLVDACHRRGMAVILDVVYNHLGPEGNYLRDFGPYFTDKHKTPWGDALNFDGPSSEGVREFFLQNALYWFRQYCVDALRLDAVHAICDTGPKHFLCELAERVAELSGRLGRKLYLIAESDLNDPRLIRPCEQGGHGLDAQWADEFHHASRTLLTGERGGYYEDFGELSHLAKAYRRGYVYAGEYSAHRKRCFGAPTDGCCARQFVVFTQNHDQVGNRMLGERLSTLVSFEALKLAAGAMLLAPYVPLLFMGEEYGEERPFLYFVSHGDPSLQTAVCEGRKAEFKAFAWRGEPPDPNDEGTFCASRLDWDARNAGRHGTLLNFYRRLIALRREVPALRRLSWREMEVSEQGDHMILLRRYYGASEVLIALNFGGPEVDCLAKAPERSDRDDGEWVKVLDSADQKWGGPGSSLPGRIRAGTALRLRPHSFALYERRWQPRHSKKLW